MGKELQRPLRELGVKVVYLYGSEASGLSTPLSDTDVGVVLRDVRPLKSRVERNRLHSRLTDLLGPRFDSDSREMDLVFLQAASPVLQYEAINAGCPLFSDDPEFQADYEASVIRDYLDVRPLVETHFQAVLERAA